MSDHVPNEQLRLEDVPLPDATWNEIGRFALTFHGYDACGSLHACAEIANARRNSTLTELRACLFFEQRRFRHFGWAPTGESLRYIRSLVEKIRCHVQGPTPTLQRTDSGGGILS